VKKTGTITYVKPRRILFKYDDPEITYLVDGQKVYEYNAKATQLQVIDLENDPQTEAFFLGFDDNTERLKQAYNVKLFTPDPKECGTKGLELLPRHEVEDVTKKERSTFEKVRISLDGQQYLPCHIEVINDKDSKTNIAISAIKTNADTAPKELTITVPEHTTIVENNDKTSDAGPGGVTFPRPGAPKPPTIKLQDLKNP
jgi:outer membrane lipoprotein-sorting protein